MASSSVLLSSIIDIFTKNGRWSEDAEDLYPTPKSADSDNTQNELGIPSSQRQVLSRHNDISIIQISPT